MVGFGLVLSACLDLTLPDLSNQWGTGPTDGPSCLPGVIDTLAPDTLKIHIIDVGQGDAIWIQTPWYSDQLLESRNILIDAGPAQHADILFDYLTTRGLPIGSKVDAIVISHAHADHYGGLSTLLETFDVLRYIDPGYSGGSPQFLDARNEAFIEVMSRGVNPESPAVPGLVSQLFQSIDLFGPEVEGKLLWGLAEPMFGGIGQGGNAEINNTSIVFSLAYGGNRALLMGDAEEDVEQALVDQAAAGALNLQANILKVGHHGSSTSSIPGFLSRVFPSASPADWAVISSGRKSFSGTQLPDTDTVQRLGTLLGAHHVLSTENRDESKSETEAAGDDHIIITLHVNGDTRACYTP